MKDGFKEPGVGKFVDALDFYDFGTDYVRSQPFKSQDTFETEHAMAEVLGPQLDVRTVYCDNHRAVAKACRRLSLSRKKAPPETHSPMGPLRHSTDESWPERELT